MVWLRKTEPRNLADNSSKGEKTSWRQTNKTQNADEGDINGQMQQKTGFLLFHLRISLSFSLPPPLVSLSMLRIPVPAFRLLHIEPSHQYLSLHPPTSKSLLSVSLLFLPLLMCLLKLSGLVLTPSSSTQPTHSALWDELWLILSLLPSLVTYIPFCSSIHVSLSVALTSYDLCIVLCCAWGNMQKVYEEKKIETVG